MSFPISIHIEGRYDDVYLYKGLLYLWTVENELKVFNWDRLVESIAKRSEETIIRWGFARNDRLHSEQFEDLRRDHEFVELLSQKLLMVDNSDIVLDEWELRVFSEFVIDSGIGDVTDLLFYRDVLYLSSVSGMYNLHIDSSNGSFGRKPAMKINDIHTVSISARYLTLNGACCEEGLFCYAISSPRERPMQAHHVDSFTRASSWLRADFLTLGADSFKYHVNLKHPISKQESRQDFEESFERSRDESSIEQYGVEVFDDAELLAGAKEEVVAPHTVFTLGNTVYVGGVDGDHYRITKWTRPIKTEVFHERGLVYKRSHQSIQADVFSGAAAASRTVVLDTDQGTLALDEDATPYSVSDNVNVAMRTFPDSRWYMNLVCSVKEDHVSITCLWPMNPRSVLDMPPF